MALSHKLEIVQKQQLIMSQEILQSLKLLELQIMDLETVIREELEVNPVLEIENDYEEVDIREIDIEKAGDPEDLDFSQNNLDLDKTYSEIYDEDDYHFEREKNEEVDIFLFIGDKVDFKEELIKQLHMNKLDQETIKMGEYIISFLDERGYLPENIIEEVVDKFNINKEKAECVLSIIHSLEPAGIGARNLKECFYLQAKKKYPYDSDILEIINDHFDLLIKNKIQKIADLMGINIDVLKIELEKLKKFSCYPVVNLNNENICEYITPDCFLIIKDDGSLDVEINNRNIPRLSLSNTYIRMYEKSDNGEVKDFLKKYINNANKFINAIYERNNTLKKVALAIFEKQKDYFLKDKKTINPLNYKEIADETGLSESTISRTVNSKYVETPYGIFSLKHFFATEISKTGISNKEIKEELKEIIENEDKRNPYSDDELVAILNERGFSISRRTVNKYRTMLNIPSSQMRKKY